MFYFGPCQGVWLILIAYPAPENNRAVSPAVNIT